MHHILSVLHDAADFIWMLLAVTCIVVTPMIGDNPHDVWKHHMSELKDDDDETDSELYD